MHIEDYNKNSGSLCLIASCVLHAIIALLLLFFHHYMTIIPEFRKADVVFIDAKNAITMVQQQVKMPVAQLQQPQQKQQQQQPPAKQQQVSAKGEEEPEDLSKYLPTATQKGDPSKPKNVIQFPGKQSASVTQSPITQSPMDGQIEETPEKDAPQDMVLKTDPIINDEITNKDQSDQRPLSLIELSPPPPEAPLKSNFGFLTEQPKAAEDMKKQEAKQDEYVSDNSGRKRRLTLADVFKQLPTLYSPTGHGHPRGVENGVDTGDVLIIAQTDFRFYGFFTNILAHLNNAFAFHRQEMDPAWNFAKNLRVDVIVDKKGYVQDVIIAQSSGLQSLDHFIKKVTLAASPLPPVPASLSQKTFRLKLIFGTMG